MDGVVQLETHHWKGQAYERAGPRFELFPNGCVCGSVSILAFPARTLLTPGLN
jgi:hypothetical protein